MLSSGRIGHVCTTHPKALFVLDSLLEPSETLKGITLPPFDRLWGLHVKTVLAILDAGNGLTRNPARYI